MLERCGTTKDSNTTKAHRILRWTSRQFSLIVALHNDGIKMHTFKYELNICLFRDDTHSIAQMHKVSLLQTISSLFYHEENKI
jgi:hypothetical protein